MIVNKPYEERRLRLLAAGLSGEILDVGFADWPNQYFEAQGRVTGVDLAEVPPVPGYWRQVVGDLSTTTELEPDSFDAVVAGEVLEHVEQPYDFLRACLKLLRPGGLMRLSTPNAVGFPALFMEIGTSRRRFFSEDHTFYFTPRWVRKMMGTVGLVDVRMKAVGLWIPGIPTLPCPVGLSYQVVYEATKGSLLDTD